MKSFIAWVRSRPQKTLVLLVAAETLIFFLLLVVLIWVLVVR